MKKFFQYINDNVLVKSANLNTANVSIKIISGILITKFIAMFIGPEGMTLIGNLRNFISTLQSLSIAGLYNGFVKFIGKSKNQIKELTKTLSTVFYFGFFITMVVSFLCFYNAEFINDFIFPNFNYAYIIETFALVLPFYALNMFIFSIMNGYSKYRILLVINITSQVLGLLVTLLLIKQEKIDGALVAVVITPALNLLISVVGIAFRKNLMTYIQISAIDFSILKKLSSNMIMALVSSIALPIVFIIIRNYLVSEIGIKEAGYWTAVTRVSDYYLMFINSLMALYILPRFAEINSRQEFRREIFSFYKTVMPILAVILLLVYLSRSFLVTLLFTEEFRPIENLFGYQVLGDFIRVLSMVIAYQFLAKKMFTHFIILEIFLFVIMYISSVYLIDEFGLEGAVMGHCLSYLMHFLIILFVFGSSLFGVLNDDGLEEY